MWFWILVIASPFLFLIILEECVHYFSNRYVLGPPKWEIYVKTVMKKGLDKVKFGKN